MLILTRQAGESVIITTDKGEQIVVKITRINTEYDRRELANPQAVLGISAPKSFNIVRSELQ